MLGVAGMDPRQVVLECGLLLSVQLLFCHGIGPGRAVRDVQNRTWPVHIFYTDLHRTLG